MNQLDELPLSELLLINPWSSAKKGTLLQMLVGKKPTIGVRCNFKVANGTLEGIAIVAGEHMGKLVLDSDLVGPALDVSGVVKIVASQLGPFRHRSPQLPPGLLVQYDGQYYLWVNVLVGTGSGFIRLADGEHFNGLPPDWQVDVAASVGVRMRPKSN